MVTYSTSCCPINGEVRWNLHLGLVRGSLGLWLLGSCFVIKAVCEGIPEECKNILTNLKEPCCQMPQLFKDPNEMKMIVECTEKYAKDISSSRTINTTVLECIEECFFNSSGVLDPNMTLNKEKVRTAFLQDIDKADEWTSVFETALNKCLETKTKQLSPDSTCTSGSRQFQICMFKETYLNCPSQKWTSSDECKVEKSLFVKCAEYIF